MPGDMTHEKERKEMRRKKEQAFAAEEAAQARAA